MIYTFKQTCKEESDIEYDDGLTILYFNANGSKGGSRDIENMLKYLQDSRNVMAVDEATKELDGYVESVKGNATLKGDYMDFGDLIDQYVKNEVEHELERELEHELEHERKEVTQTTLRDAIFDLLDDKWKIPDALRNKINEVTDPERLRALLLLAARSQSLEEFEQKMNE